MRFVKVTLAVAAVAAGIFGPIQHAFAQQTAAVIANSGADTGNDRSLLDRRAKLDIRDVVMAVALTRLAERSGVSVAFSPNALPAERTVTCACSAVTVAQALDTILVGTLFEYRPLHDQIVIIPMREPIRDPTSPTPRVHFASLGQPPPAMIRLALARQGTVTGQVNELGTGRPLVGARVQILATNLGALTDAEGRFRIVDVPAGDVEVQVQLLGYVTATQSATVASRATATVNFELAPDPLALDEVVAVGYGTAQRRDLTGSITSLRTDNLAAGFRSSPQQLIQGRAAGVDIIHSSGKPGGSSIVRIRGGTSISAGNDPLYVIDGVPIAVSNRQTSIGGGGGSGFQIFDQEPVNPLNALNPADIESIEILKDASAAAIYGSRGANGVIIITTKRGEPGAIQTRYETRFGVSSVSRKLDVLSADQYRQVAQELGLTIDDRGSSTNWQDAIFRNAPSQSHNLSLSGGSETSRYRASLGYDDQKGIILNSGIRTFTGRLATNHSALDSKLLIDLNLTAAQISQDNAPISNQLSGEGANMLKDALRFNPTFPIYEADGSFSYLNQFSINPVSYAEHIEDRTDTRRFLGNIHSSYRLFDPLTVDVNLAYTRQDADRKAYVPKVNPLGEGVQGRALAQSSVDWSKLLETTVRFEQLIGDQHRIDAIGGYSYQYFQDEGYRAQASGFISDAFKWFDLAAASDINTLNSYQESNTLISFYGRVNYSIGDRYLLTATIRRDGSSRFGDDNKWGLFPSGSVAWRIADEAFFPETALLNDLKLRVSYG
ncbi:MAG: SusC/RagA family TonB-linked outer membrane protein, partial [Longimicrobiales bacterium]